MSTTNHHHHHHESLGSKSLLPYATIKEEDDTFSMIPIVNEDTRWTRGSMVKLETAKKEEEELGAANLFETAFSTDFSDDARDVKPLLPKKQDDGDGDLNLELSLGLSNSRDRDETISVCLIVSKNRTMIHNLS